MAVSLGSPQDGVQVKASCLQVVLTAEATMEPTRDSPVRRSDEVAEGCEVSDGCHQAVFFKCLEVFVGGHWWLL